MFISNILKSEHMSLRKSAGIILFKPNLYTTQRGTIIMTKIKNTKKGMAKKTLSMSLVVAMLATSNVPVWAAEFSDGSDVAVATEADAFAADETETPAVEDTDEDTSSASVVESGDIKTELKADKTSVVWGDDVKATVSGTIAVANNASVGTVKYRWMDENETAVGTPGSIADLNAVSIELSATSKLAGKKLTLWIYTENTNTAADFNINTGITITIEKQKLSDYAVFDKSGVTELSYNGFDQGIDVSKVKVKDKASTPKNITPNCTLTSTSAKDAEKTVTVTATANEDSPYTGSISTDFSIDKKEYAEGDILADVDDTLVYQYTGDDIAVPLDKVTLKESKSEDGGLKDKRLGGADLHAAVKKAVVAKNDATPSAVDSGKVTVTIDTDKLTNFKAASGSSLPGSLHATKKVTIKQRDLTTAGTKITMKYANVPAGAATTADKLAEDYLTFTAAEGGKLSLKKGTDYTISIKNPSGNEVSELTDVGTYTVTVAAKDGGNCTGSQTFNVTTTHSVITGATYSNVKYAPSYTGSEIKPSKEDLGTISITYADGKTANNIQADQYEIVGYTNNINATVYKTASNATNKHVGENNAADNIESQASVNIKLTGNGFNGETVSVPFNILPLKVTAEDIKVPATISYNKGYTKEDEYKIPVTVTAKDKDGKNKKVLDEKDFTVKYAFGKDTSGNTQTNLIGSKIYSTVTITNTNYIYGSADVSKYTVPDAKKTVVTTIAAKVLTDSMVVANPATYTYTGGKITPTYYVMDGQTVLYKKGDIGVEDSMAEYKETSITDAVNVGTGKINVTGIAGSDNKSGYSGNATGTFTITPANTADVKVTFPNDAERNYTGKQVRPRTFKVTLNGNDVTDQFEVVSYGENISGKGTVVLKPVDGNKNFTGANVTAEFNIVKEEVKADLKAYDDKGFEATAWYAKASDSSAPKKVYTDKNGTVKTDADKAFDFDGTAHTFAKVLLSNITREDGNKTTAKADDFEIKYVDNVAGKKVDGCKNVGYVYAVAKDGTGFAGTTTLVTADGTIIKNVVAYKAFSIASVNFVAKNVTVKNGTYAAGLPVKPQVIVQIGGTTLTEGKDYKLTLINAPTANAKDTLIERKTEATPTDVTTTKPYGVYIEGINGYEGSSVISMANDDAGSDKLVWGVDKKNIGDCTVTVKDGVTTVLNGYLPVAAAEYTSKNNGDGTYTVTANSTSKNYTGSKTVKADGKAEDEKPDAPMISSVKVVGNKATVILSGDSDGAAGYDYVISTDRDCITNKDYDSVNKNQVQTSTTFKYVQQGTYYAYCHAWKRDANGKKVFSDWSNAYPFVVSAITPDAPVITNVKVSGSTIKVTYKAAANATGYDVVLGTDSKKENGETRPYHYGDHKVLNLKEGTVTATFKNVPKGTWVVGMHAFNRTSEDGKKVFSPWSNLKKATVK